MQCRALRPSGSSSTDDRPLSSSTRWNSSGPSPSCTPVNRVVYGFIRSPVEERGSSCRNTSRSWKVGSIFSIPTTEIRVRGRVRHIRPLPSDSTTTSVPVSATAKFAPQIATEPGMSRNFSRRKRRAASASSTGSSVMDGSRSGIAARKISRISARLRWIAGTRMWEGVSSASWTMSSARSDSIARMPACASASFRPISWVAIDLTFSTSRASRSSARRVTISEASSASRAQCTTPPAAATDSSSCSSSSGR